MRLVFLDPASVCSSFRRVLKLSVPSFKWTRTPASSTAARIFRNASVMVSVVFHHNACRGFSLELLSYSLLDLILSCQLFRLVCPSLINFWFVYVDVS